MSKHAEITEFVETKFSKHLDIIIVYKESTLFEYFYSFGMHPSNKFR